MYIAQTHTELKKRFDCLSSNNTLPIVFCAKLKGEVVLKFLGKIPLELLIVREIPFIQKPYIL